MSAENIINNLFKQLAGIYPAWRNAFKSTEEIDNAKKQWLIAFQEVELNQVEWIERGLKEARQDTSPFLPSVGQFIDWCRYDEKRDNPVWFLKGLGEEQKMQIIAHRKKQGLPCGEYDKLAIGEDKC